MVQTKIMQTKIMQTKIIEVNHGPIQVKKKTPQEVLFMRGLMNSNGMLTVQGKKYAREIRDGSPELFLLIRLFKEDQK